MISEMYIGGDMVCDFCGDPDIHKTYRCPDFSFMLRDIRCNSVGDWMACEPCATAVDAGDGGALANRCVNAHCLHNPQEDNPISRSDIFYFLQPIHEQFFSLYTGSEVWSE
jgi:hypothetical protein